MTSGNGCAHSNSQVIRGDVDGWARMVNIVDGRMGMVDDVDEWVGMVDSG